MEETLVYMVPTYSKFVFPHQITESHAFFWFCKEDYSVPHFKTVAQPTPSDLKTEKDNGKHRVRENKILIRCMVGT